MGKYIHKISRKVATFSGGSVAISLAFIIVFGWIIGGFFIGFANQNYSLLINTVANTAGFLMLFLIQSSQNNDTLAIQLKLDELIRTNKEARNAFIGLEEKEENQKEILAYEREFATLESEE